MSYSKLHSSIVNSSLWCEQDAIRILFITLLAMCDRDGIVYGSRAGLARAAMIDPEKANEAWTALLSPDPDSSDKIRAPENEGRRIEEVSGGFRLLNFEYYRGLRNDDERREQNRVAQAKFRVSQRKPASAKVSHSNPPSSQAEAEAEAILPSDQPLAPTQAAKPSWSKLHGWQNVSEEMKQRWAEAFPACNIDLQLQQMTLWCEANPKKAVKTNWLNFITNWLSKHQNRGGDTASNKPNGINRTEADRDRTRTGMQSTAGQNLKRLTS